MVTLRRIAFASLLFVLFAVVLPAALSPTALFALSPAQVTQADNLEAELDTALQNQADPGETIFAVTSQDGNLENDPLVRAEVASRYITAGWTTAVWQGVGSNVFYLVLIE